MSAHPAPSGLPAAPVVARPGDTGPISDAEWAVLQAVRDLSYGQVEIVIHSSRIVQITRSQKLRLGE